MRILFLIVFGAGLAMAVYTMLNGVERKKRGSLSRPRPYLNFPVLGAFTSFCGAVGYLLVKSTALGAGWILLIGISAGAAAWIGMTVLMAKWALKSEGTNQSSHEEIQGHLAVVVAPLEQAFAGSIRYELNGLELESPARSIDGRTLLSGAEVVIDRFEENVAIVEDWAAVEKRL